MTTATADTIGGSSPPTAPAPAARREVSIWERIPRVVSITGFALTLVFVWQCLVWLQVTSEFVLPAPWEVVQQIWEVVKSIVTGGYILDSFWITSKEIALGFLCAAIAGIGLGMLVAETAFGRIVVLPFLVAVYAAPIVALAPIFVAWLGFGIWAKVALGGFIAFFPLLIATATGLIGVDAERAALFRSLRASRWQTFYKLKLPTALPFIFSGLKTAAVLAVVGAVVGEFLGGGAGLGELISVSASQLATARVFAYVFILASIGYAFYLLVAWAERKVVFWRETHVFGAMPDH